MPRLSLVTVPAAARSLTALAGRVLLTVLLLAGILVLAPEAEAEPASANLDAPLALMESGRYEEAAQSLIQLLPDMDPGAAREARTHLAECYELSGSWTDAARLWHDLAIGTLDRDQRSAALFREASARQEAGELEEAAELYVGFHYLRPGSAAQSEALSRAADGFAALDRWPVAASYYQLALEHSTNPGERLGLAYRLSEALLLSGQGNAALAALVAETGSVAADDLPRYQYQRARLELSLGQARAGEIVCSPSFRSTRARRTPTPRWSSWSTPASRWTSTGAASSTTMPRPTSRPSPPSSATLPLLRATAWPARTTSPGSATGGWATSTRPWLTSTPPSP